MREFGAGKYKVVTGGVEYAYTNWNDIPAVFDHLIQFIPDIPPAPHTDKEHEMIDSIPEIFKQFMRKERHASRN